MCLSPRSMTVQDMRGMPKLITFPCGKCEECVKRYQDSWKIRMVSEFNHTCLGVYATLTYDDDSCPIHPDCIRPDGSFILNEFAGKRYKVKTKNGGVYYRVYDGITRIVDKRSIQNWFKRFRENFFRTNGYRLDFSYFLTSEYGPNSYRPHYHLCIFGQNAETLKPLFDDWNNIYGDAQFEDIRIAPGKSPGAVADYCSKYCAKGMFESPLCKESPSRSFVAPKTFHLISKGLGLCYVNKHIYEHLCLDTFVRSLTDLGSSCDLVETSDVFFALVQNPSLISQLLPRSYVNTVISKNKIVDSGNYVHSLPRYFYDKIFKPCSASMLSKYSDPVSEFYDPKRAKVELFKQNSLALLPLSIAGLLLEKSNNLYLQKLEEIRAVNPSWSDFQILSFASQFEDSRRSCKRRALRKTLADRYNNSYI